MEGETFSITMNFPNLITANQKCKEKHFLWVSGGQQVGQPTCHVQTPVCLSDRESDARCQSCSMSKRLNPPLNSKIPSGSCVIPLNFLGRAMGNVAMAKGYNLPISAVIHLTAKHAASAARDWPNVFIYWTHQTTSCHALRSSSPN